MYEDNTSYIANAIYIINANNITGNYDGSAYNGHGNPTDSKSRNNFHVCGFGWLDNHQYWNDHNQRKYWRRYRAVFGYFVYSRRIHEPILYLL